MIRQMGGDVTFASPPGQGATLTIVVPFDVDSDEAQRCSLDAALPRRTSGDLHAWLSEVAVLTALPACGVGACISRMAATWGAAAREAAQPPGGADDAPAVARQLRAEAASAASAGGSPHRAVLLVVNAPTMAALCSAGAPPLPRGAVCVLAAAPAERAAWTAEAAAARGCCAPAAFLELPTSPGRLRARLAAALDAAVRPEPAECAPVAAPAPVPAAALPEAPALRVLMAEDNALNARVATAVLGRCGVRGDALTCVTDGAQAVDAVAQAAAPFDIILMDMLMPRMDGPEAARRIRAHEAATGCAPTWIVACTASSAAEDREECLDAGMNYFLEKPLHPEAMRSLLRRHAAVRAAGGDVRGAAEHVAALPSVAA
jgi:CheY-like chemotaxis protein